MTQPIIPRYQPHLSPAIPAVIGNKDYDEFRARLERMDEILVHGGVEAEFVRWCIEHQQNELIEEMDEEDLAAGSENEREPARKSAANAALTSGYLNRLQKTARRALRCNLARRFLAESYRAFTNRLADSPLFQWFCLIDQLAVIRVPSKSTLERFDKIVPEEIVHKVIDNTNVKAALIAATPAAQPLGLAAPIEIDEVFIDTSCIKANIHFPVDWVLLRDVVLRLIALIMVLRGHGLKQRMPPPETFIQSINRLCLQMGHSRRKTNARKERKRILRLMKTVVKNVRAHAQRYRELLIGEWPQTDLSENQMQQILRRMDHILKQLPKAVRQAHERIIGERPVKNEEKILSLHEPDIHVIVRGKAGAEVEFGNSWVIVEQSNGLILYSRLIKDQAEADCNLLIPAVNQIREIFNGYPKAIGGDRGFDSKEGRDFLTTNQIYNGICPKDPQTLKERMKEERFPRLQKRRAQTEGRIGLFKNSFLGGLLRSKGFLHRQSGVAWAVLAHNLWCLARLPQYQEAAQPAKAA